MSQSDFAFSNDVRAAVELRTPRTSRMLLFASAGLMVTFLIWANFAVLDEGQARQRPRGPVEADPGRAIARRRYHQRVTGSGRRHRPKRTSRSRVLKTRHSHRSSVKIRERRGAMAARVLRLEAETLGRKASYFRTN